MFTKSRRALRKALTPAVTCAASSPFGPILMRKLNEVEPTSIRRRSSLAYIGPLAFLLILSFGSLFGLLYHLTIPQDRLEHQREVALVENATVSTVRLAAHDLRDYAIWDEAVTHMVTEFDHKWAENNLGPYLGKAQSYDYVLVFDGNDRLIYNYSHVKHDGLVNAKMVLGPAFTQNLADVRRVQLGSDPLIAGYSRSGSSIYVFAVSAIVPLTANIRLPSGRTHAIAIARKVDAAFFEQMLSRTNALKLNLTFKSIATDASVVLRSQTGNDLGTLIWRPEKPGSVLRKNILPAFLLIGLLGFVVALTIIRNSRRTIEALWLSENHSRRLAQQDPLTGLPNRRAMHDKLQGILGGGASGVTLLYMDLDGFKETNDLYGHGVGDALLIAVSKRLGITSPSGSLLARVGGDEFAIVMNSQTEALCLGQNILADFEPVFSIGEYSVGLGISIGLATGRETMDSDELIRQADSAMYSAKSRGKHCLEIYCPSLDAGRKRRMKLESELRVAIENGSIGVVYQPIVCASSRRIVAVEALARWSHPLHGFISPDEFIPIAESSGLIVPLGKHILKTSCKDALDWGVRLAVNLSPAQFWDRGLLNAIKEVLESTSFPAERLELEITEGYLMRRPESAKEILGYLKRMGIRIALDDFGTGFASIGYLQRLGFDLIKIDRSFISASDGDGRAGGLARAIVAIGHALDVPVTAEGVETLDQARFMQAAGCSRLQGWLFGKPVPCAEMKAWFTDENRQAS